ncbi:trypsin-like peptidase domain-containing protein [Grimontia sp. SpTr1]|uniref:trypsin-like peptidase domain-containing protein n=1 Tax=Grimontia sp. SpTr1 TaxID=2995319 RepID=UPI00248B0004|nr:trypsin-like peptidase domain-containing protein [Grimontia sp. SpTr1]
MFQAFSKVMGSVFLLCSLQGCILINGPLDYADTSNEHDVNYLAIGIPFVLGGHGTSVPLTPEISLTAKHVAKLDYSEVIAYHPDCDVALIKEDNTDKRLASLGTVQTDGGITTVGMGLTGKVLLGKGKYYRDVNFVDSTLFARCPASITDAPIQSGMSGGGAFNENGELVGIISGMSSSGFRMLDGSTLGNERTSVFVSTLYVRGWLIESIETYYGDSIDNLTAGTPSFSAAYLSE